MKKSILATAVALSAGLFASSAMAVLPPIEMTGSTVNFSGNLIPAACEVSVASQNMAIDLGVVDKATFSGNAHVLSPFDITFENCDTAVASAMDVVFTTGVLGSMPHLAVNEATDTPSDALLVITSSLGNLPLDGTRSATSTVQITDGTMAVTYTPKYTHMTSMPAATPGNTLYNMTYKVIYQ